MARAARALPLDAARTWYVMPMRAIPLVVVSLLVMARGAYAQDDPCDGVDNDQDGTVDETCDCVDRFLSLIHISEPTRPY